jgi:hypothetical protein
MTPVGCFALPHNGRCEIYPDGERPRLCRQGPEEAHYPARSDIVWLELPCPMPHSLFVITVGNRVVAAWADGKQVRWRDLDTVTEAVRQYNADCGQRAA